MPSRISAWGIYDVFAGSDGEQIFLAVVSDTQWKLFCDAFGYGDLFADARLATNNGRVNARAWMMPDLRTRLGAFTAGALGDIHGVGPTKMERFGEIFLELLRER